MNIAHFSKLSHEQSRQPASSPLNIMTLMIPGKTTVLINLSALVPAVQSSEANYSADNLLSVWL